MTHRQDSKRRLYWDWVSQEAVLVKSDGCSKVSGAFRKHCRVHDLAYFYAKDPVAAYKRYLDGDPDYWANAPAITKAQADADFRRGMQSDSAFGFFSPLAAWRWLGLKMGGQGAWDAHRAREAADAGAVDFV